MADVTLERFRLPNVAPYCEVTTDSWTGSTTGETLFTPDGVSTGPWTGKVALPPVNPLSSFVFHYTLGGVAYSVVALDDGTIADANIVGQINQDGTYTISSNTPLDAVACTADYSYGIAPSNIENALDPNNPNPSDWGWTSTTGAGYYAFLKFELPEDGLYLFTYVFEAAPSSPAASIRGRSFSYHSSDPNYRAQYDYISSIYMDTGKIVLSLPTTMLKKMLLKHYITAACEFKIRFWDFKIFKLA